MFSKEQYLAHYGVMGMKWGITRSNKGASKAYDKMRSAKKQLKSDSKAYNKSFGKAYDKSITAYSPIKKHRENNNKRWSEAQAKLDTYKESKKSYKETKKNYKAAVKEAKKPSYKKMSDEQLKKRVNRLNMEKQYAQLTNKDTGKGKQYINNILKTGGRLAGASTTAITLYNNTNKIKKMIGK